MPMVRATATADRAVTVELVEYCLSNVPTPARAMLQACGLPVREDSCLQRCGCCYDGPFLVVDGEVVEGASHREILERIGRGAGSGDG